MGFLFRNSVQDRVTFVAVELTKSMVICPGAIANKQTSDRYLKLIYEFI